MGKTTLLHFVTAGKQVSALKTHQFILEDLFLFGLIFAVKKRKLVQSVFETMKIKILSILFVCFIPVGINKVYSQPKMIEYYKWDKNCEFKTRPGTFIINNVAQFNEMSDCSMPRFDFDNHTIIGVQGTSPGHFQPKVDISIYQNDIDKKIIIEVTLSGGKLCEACRVNRPFYRRIIYTDKLNSEYSIEFNYIKIDG